MTSKVLVKLPVVPFSQRKKTPSEIISLPNRNDESDEKKFSKGRNIDRVTQLEQNMKYLQDQHQATLVALHREVEVLQQRNRDLQFQLVFSKGTNFNSSCPSSPEHGESEPTKIEESLECVDAESPRVELLEKNLQDAKTDLDEARTRNIHLSEVIEKLKKTLELNEKSKEKQKMTDVGIQVDGVLECQQVELQARLDDAKELVKKLLQKNMDQFEEIATMKSAVPYSNGNVNRSGNSQARKFQHGHNNHGSVNEVQSQEENYHKFPLLQTQSYWHRASRGNHNYDHKSHSGYRRNNRHHRERQDLETDADNIVLPQLQNGSVRIGKNVNYQSNFKSGLHSGGHYYTEERVYRKYRGQKLQRDHRDQDAREYNRECKYRESKENQRQHQREFSQSSKETRDCTTTQRQ